MRHVVTLSVLELQNFTDINSHITPQIATIQNFANSFLYWPGLEQWHSRGRNCGGRGKKGYHHEKERQKGHGQDVGSQKGCKVRRVTME